MSRLLKSQGFTIGLLSAVCLAFAFPDLGAAGGPLRTDYTTKLGVVVIFLLQGLSLPTRSILRSSINWKLNLFCQSWIFIGSPLLMLVLLWIGHSWLDDATRTGLIYLSVLPTTISSAVTLTSNSEGDTGGALFNTSFSNILGIFLTPLWCLALLHSASGQFPPLAPLLAKLALLILAPLAVGQLVRPLARDPIDRLKTSFRRISNGLIAFIVYASFCNSVQRGTWNNIAPASIALYLAICLVFLLALSLLVWKSSAFILPTPQQRIAGFFCASQKTLAAGAPMAAVIFAGHNQAQISLVIVPILCYHSLQLFLGGGVSGQFALLTKEAR